MSHLKAAAGFKRKQSCLFIPSVILSTACSILSFILSVVSENPYIGLEITIGVLSIITSGLVTLNNSLEYQKICSEHMVTAQLYDSIQSKLKLQTMDYDSSFNYAQFFEDIQNQIEENKARTKIILPLHLQTPSEDHIIQVFEQQLDAQLQR